MINQIITAARSIIGVDSESFVNRPLLFIMVVILILGLGNIFLAHRNMAVYFKKEGVKNEEIIEVSS